MLLGGVDQFLDGRMTGLRTLRHKPFHNEERS
jgi:hypothetical protein